MIDVRNVVYMLENEGYDRDSVYNCIESVTQLDFDNEDFMDWNEVIQVRAMLSKGPRLFTYYDGEYRTKTLMDYLTTPGQSGTLESNDNVRRT